MLTGNRNFEGRINPLVKANYLASPPLVVAYALAGTTDIDLINEPLGNGNDGTARLPQRHLADARPKSQDGRRRVRAARDVRRRNTATSWTANAKWNAITTSEGELYDWDADSTYIQEPPFLIDLAAEPGPIQPIRRRARAWRCSATR